MFEDASIIKLDINVEYMCEDVLKPTETYRFSWLMLLSIDDGTQMILVSQLLRVKWSVRYTESVRVCEAPIKTKPSKANY